MSSCLLLKSLLQVLEHLFFGAQKALLGRLPIDHLPDVVNVCGLAVQVLVTRQ